MLGPGLRFRLNSETPLKMNKNGWFHLLIENKVSRVQFRPNKTPHLGVKGPV